jgi:UDP-glucose 4-epimerase
MDLEGRTCAVLGAGGFIGGAVSRKLASQGASTAGFTRETPFVTASGNLHPDVAAADLIFWLVSSIRPANADDSSNATADQSALECLLTGLSRSDSAARLLAVSSGGTVYDPRARPPYRETSPTRAVNAYGEAMLTVEQLLRAAWPNHVILRASNVYGPGQPARRGQGVIAHWVANVLRHEPIQVIGAATTKRDYVYIDDLVGALLRAAICPDAPKLINIGSGAATSLAQLCECLVETVQEPIDVEHLPARGFDAPSTWLDISLAKQALGWSPAVELRTGLMHTWHSVVAVSNGSPTYGRSMVNDLSAA